MKGSSKAYPEQCRNDAAPAACIVSGPGRTIPKGRCGPGNALPVPKPTPPVPMKGSTKRISGAVAAIGAASEAAGGVQQESSIGVAAGGAGAGTSSSVQAAR